MSEAKNEVWITGIGILSAAGEGKEAHLAALRAAKPLGVDADTFAPFVIHKLAEPEWATQISRRDMRQMEPWQQIGTYAAGLALEDAGVKDNEELCGTMDMIVAAGGGERDEEVDTAIMAEARSTGGTDALLANKLSNDLRPTLFLAQLSNLLAGNISIVHKVTGSSRTFMGEEGAGISALQTAAARIASGQSKIALAGGGYNAERNDMLLFFSLGGFAQQGAVKPVGERKDDTDGLALGSIGAFLVLESADHAKARGAKAYAKLSPVAVGYGLRDGAKETLRIADVVNKAGIAKADMILTGASGVPSITAAENSVLAQSAPNTPHRSYGTVFGHGVETQFPLGVALAALAIKSASDIPPFEAAETVSNGGSARSILITTVGHNRAEGAALVSALDANGSGETA
ncbi:MAG: beta-ketoacyl-ACP synthase [Pseudomonadota bacterium]